MDMRQVSKIKKVCFGQHCFEVEVAQSLLSQMRGLMFRRHLDADKGMLFVFDHETIVPFWMAFTYIPLDIIWLDASGTIVDIRHDAQPCKGLMCPAITPRQKALYALEVNGGSAHDFGIKTGGRADVI